jgi:hypothetical protein
MKNMDPLNDNVVTLLQASHDVMTRELWKDGRNGTLIDLFANDNVYRFLSAYDRRSSAMNDDCYHVM